MIILLFEGGERERYLSRLGKKKKRRLQKEKKENTMVSDIVAAELLGGGTMTHEGETPP